MQIANDLSLAAWVAAFGKLKSEPCQIRIAVVLLSVGKTRHVLRPSKRVLGCLSRNGLADPGKERKRAGA